MYSSNLVFAFTQHGQNRPTNTNAMRRSYTVLVAPEQRNNNSSASQKPRTDNNTTTASVSSSSPRALPTDRDCPTDGVNASAPAASTSVHPPSDVLTPTRPLPVRMDNQ